VAARSSAVPAPRPTLCRLVQRVSCATVKLEGAVRGDVTSTDIILMGALLAQPLSSAPDWDAIARRQAAIYVAGLRPADGPPLPGRALTRAVLEQSFTQSSRNRPR
jgi:hypothetical protein